MDINTQLDGFIIHPLDAFKNSQQEEFIPPISSSTPDFDEFQVHPLDSFFAREHNINNDNININEIAQENTYFPTNETYETDNTFNTNEISTNNFELEQNHVQDIISTTPAINIDNIDNNDNNDLNYNQYETTENFSTQEYPVTHNDSSSNNNYLTSNSTDIISLNYESNNINTFTTDSYENYTNTNDNINYSKILPTKILPTINETNDNDIIPSSSIDLNPITTEQNEINEYPITSPINNEYTIPSDITYSKSTFSPSINLESDISLPFSELIPTYSSTTLDNSPSTFNDINTNNYKVDEYNIEPITPPPEYKPAYKETSYNPKINWKKIIPIKTKIIIPKVKKYIIKRKQKIIVPKKQKIIVPTVIVQPQQTINMSQTQPTIPQNYINILPNQSILINSIPLANQNSLIVNSNVTEKFPMDNFSLHYGASRIYYPRNLKL